MGKVIHYAASFTEDNLRDGSCAADNLHPDAGTGQVRHREGEFVLGQGVQKGIPLLRERSKAKKNSASWKSKVVKMNWFKGGSNVLKKGHYGIIYDIDTGISLRIKRMGGHYHADVEPATAADTAKLKRVAGGHFSWGSEAVILKAGGKYVACGINTKPHGDQTIRGNNYNGQFCLHMSSAPSTGPTGGRTGNRKGTRERATENLRRPLARCSDIGYNNTQKGVCG